MVIVEYSMKTNAPPELVWSLWSDVKNWNQWDKEILFSELRGPFAPDSVGFFKPKGGFKMKFKLLNVVPKKSFANCSNLFLASLTFTHWMKAERGGTQLTYKAEINGPLAFLFSKLIGPRIKKGLPIAVRRFCELAENIQTSD